MANTTGAAVLIAQADHSMQAGALEQAQILYGQALEQDPGNLAVLNNLGVISKRRECYTEATAYFQQALAAAPGDAPANYNLGNILLARQQYQEAAECFHRALRREPEQARLLNGLGNAFRGLGRTEEAKALYLRAVALDSGYVESLDNLGAIALEAKRYREATAHFNAVLSLRPDYAKTYYHLGIWHYQRRDFKRAFQFVEQALQWKPDFGQARVFLASLHLLFGNLAEGLKYYESRFWREAVEDDWDYRFFRPIPRWQGELFHGHRLIVRAEQGYGDLLQFVRYLPMVKARGGYVILAAWPETLRLLEGLPGTDALVPYEEETVCSLSFDAQISLLSLPWFFGTTLQTIPADIPYLTVTPELSQYWRSKLKPSEFLRVGLVWGGSADNRFGLNRSCGLQALAPLAQVKGIAYYSLQKGPAAAELLRPPPGLQVVDLTGDIADFADTAALIGHLDLVVTIDTSVLHLAGALGKPVWGLLPYLSEWRWLLDRDDSPWYPTLRLFRQRREGDWADVMRELASALGRWAAR